MSETRKATLFLSFLAALFLGFIGYFAWQSHGEKVWVAQLLEEVQQLPRSPSAGPSLLTGRLVSPSKGELKSHESQHPCVAFAIRVEVYELTEEGEETVYPDPPLIWAQLPDLKLAWKDRSLALDLQVADLSLWLSEAQPIARVETSSDSLPAYFSEPKRAPFHGQKKLPYEVSEFILTEGQEVTILAQVDGRGVLTAGEYPVIIVPGNEARFIAALEKMIDSASGQERLALYIAGGISLFLVVVLLGVRAAARPQAEASAERPSRLRLVLAVILLIVMFSPVWLVKFSAYLF